jgi:ribulose-phosphate 3-epimerase
MKDMKKVAVAIHATKEFDINSILDLKNLDFIHVDVMDGIFVKNTMLNLDIFQTLKKYFTIPIIAHLMVKNPIDYIDKIIDNVDAVFFHFEADGDILFTLKSIGKHHKKKGIVINPSTSVSKIIPLLSEVDFVLIMGVDPGWSGQNFLPETIEKVNQLAQYKEKYKFEIDVDGGVNLKNARELKNADILSSSSTILKASDPNEAINLLKEL